MESEGNKKDTVVTQVSFGGFGRNVTAKELTEFLEEEVGLVWRCRLKTSCTPPDSFPDFRITDMAGVWRSDNYKKVEPHAFVHFALPKSATRAMEASGRGGLFFKNQLLKASLGPESSFHMNQRRRTMIPFKLVDVGLEIGTLVSPGEFIVGWRGPSSGIEFLVDPFDRTCKFCFSRDMAFSFRGSVEHAVIKCNFKMEFLVREITEISNYKDSSGFVIMLQLASPPWLWYRTADDDVYETVAFDVLDDDDPWIRTTDFTPSGAFGRCNSYRVSISPRYEGKLKNIWEYLQNQRVRVHSLKWPPSVRDELDFGIPMSDIFSSIHYRKGIEFEILFLVNAVMHKGIFNQYRMTGSFFDLLRSQPKEVNLAALKHIWSSKCPVFDAYKRLKLVQEWILKNPKVLQRPKQMIDIVEIRRLVITPTKAYCLPPEVELSNRVLRRYNDVSDRFLRVTFMDEGMQTINLNVLNYYVASIVKDLTSNSAPQKTTVFKRVKTILTNGFNLCGRKYSFLAFSSNQLRDRSAWFFAEDKNISVHNITNWMGKFTDRNVAKCAARMGQCFSSTYATIEVPSLEVNFELKEIKRNGYVFSDGIGTISHDLTMEVVEKLKLDMNNPPSAFQIRYAGCKGVVACWPSKGDGIRLSLRPSMNKFTSNHAILEICSWTRFQPGFLNRQIVTLLSALNVPDEVFWDMMESMIFKLHKMVEDPDVAFEVLLASCSEQGNSAAIMLSAGFNPLTEPHLRGMLASIRAAQLWGLREKARIFVPSGRWLMGCLDELAVLEQGQCFIQVSSPSLQNCFSKHGSRFSEIQRNLEVVKGFVVIAKNPCLHPGDIRILEAVDAPDLHHLCDCLVFPQKGDRPHTNEASGSDLDGDLYFVTWDENLVPPSKRSWTPMDYEPADTKTLTHPVSHSDIIGFFAKNMVHENLGAICNAHVVHADRSEYGALDENCILLAELAAIAVDFPKTGKLVTMPSHLKPKIYPDFMGKEDYRSYKSNKILGRLYRRIKDVYNDDTSNADFVTGDIPYDTDLDKPGSAGFLLDAWAQKCLYDWQLTSLLGQYKVKREEEIVTGHVWSMPRYTSRKEGELKERLKHSYSVLKKEFRQIFENMHPEFEQLTEDEKNILYEQKASAWYQVCYHPKWVDKSRELQEPVCAENPLMLSFAWIAVDYLARIKIKSRQMGDIDSTKPVNSLARYLADRI